MFFTKRKAILLFVICSIFFFLTYQDVKSSEITSVSGYAKVTDGDTIKIDTFKIRLDGIDAPEKKQTCKRPYFTIFMFTFYEDYSCGQKSTEALIKKINNQKITCKISDVDYFKRLIGECYKRKINLNADFKTFFYIWAVFQWLISLILLFYVKYYIKHKLVSI